MKLHTLKDQSSPKFVRLELQADYFCINQVGYFVGVVAQAKKATSTNSTQESNQQAKRIPVNKR
jgi:hypothetical protein